MRAPLSSLRRERGVAGEELGRSSDGAALEYSARLEEVADVVDGEPADEDPAVELVYQQALVAEEAERLAHGAAGDTEDCWR